MSREKRRHFSPEEKVKILRLHLVEGKAVSALCEEFGIHPTLFYQWQRQLFENATRVFDNPQARSRAEEAAQAKIQSLEERLSRKHEVLSELMEEHVRLKKELGEN